MLGFTLYMRLDMVHGGGSSPGHRTHCLLIPSAMRPPGSLLPYTNTAFLLRRPSVKRAAHSTQPQAVAHTSRSAPTELPDGTAARESRWRVRQLRSSASVGKLPASLSGQRHVAGVGCDTARSGAATVAAATSVDAALRLWKLLLSAMHNRQNDLQQCRQRVLRKHVAAGPMWSADRLRLPIVLPLRVSGLPSAEPLTTSSVVLGPDDGSRDTLGLPPLRSGAIGAFDALVAQPVGASYTMPTPAPADVLTPLGSVNPDGLDVASSALRACLAALTALRRTPGAAAEDAVSAAVSSLLPHLGVLRAQATTIPRVREAAELRLFGCPPGGVALRRRSTIVRTYHKKIDDLLLQVGQREGGADATHADGLAILIS